MSEPPRFDTFRKRAERLVEQPARVQTLTGQAVRKLAHAGGDKLSGLRGQLEIAIALVRAWLSGDYRQVSNKTVVILVAALLYFVVPLDVVPDFLFGWGLLDDAAVLGYVFTQLRHEIDTFSRWQDEKDSADAPD